MRVMNRVVLVTLLVVAPAMASAQTESDSSLFWDVTKGVVLDPTTYAPAVFAYTSMKMDWDSSQPLFRNGWVEQNHRFTTSGRAFDTPLTYAEGNRKIRQMALLHLQESAVNNVAANLFERVLSERHPGYRRLFKTLSWVERIAFSSYVSYLASASHFKQAQQNRQLAAEFGYR